MFVDQGPAGGIVLRLKFTIIVIYRCSTDDNRLNKTRKSGDHIPSDMLQTRECRRSVVISPPRPAPPPHRIKRFFFFFQIKYTITFWTNRFSKTKPCRFVLKAARLTREKNHFFSFFKFFFLISSEGRISNIRWYPTTASSVQ